MMFKPDEAQSKALETWYDQDHPLHLDPLHPAIGLAGEAGELLDLYKKERFKDGVSWWDCKICHGPKGSDCHEPISEKNEMFGYAQHNYTPLILDELGDLWYYLRILAYQRNVNITDFIKYYHENKTAQEDATIIVALTNIMHWSSRVLHDLVFPINVPKYRLSDYPLVRITFWIYFLLNEFDCTLDQLTELNYDKLKDGDHHSWKKTAP